jgi:ABC-2 type transport system ATP-binding protein
LPPRPSTDATGKMLARQWGILERRNAAFANLSGGERQRLFVALALISNPSLSSLTR